MPFRSFAHFLRSCKTLFFAACFLLLSSFPGVGQGTVDSLQEKLQHTLADSTRSRTLSELTKALSSRDRDKALEKGQKALRSAKSSDFQKGVAMAHNALGIVRDKSGDYQKADHHYGRSLSIWKAIGDKGKIAVAYNNLGIIHYFKGEYPQAIDYYKKALTIKKERGQQKALARTYNNIGIIHKDQGRYDKAIAYFLKCLEIEDERGDEGAKARTYTNIGSLHRRQGDHEKALEYYQKALDAAKDLNDKSTMADNYHNIGLVYEQKEELNRSHQYFSRSLEIEKALDRKKGIATSSSQIAEVLFQMHVRRSDSLEGPAEQSTPLTEPRGGLLDSAQELQEKALKIFKRIGNLEGMVHSFLSLGRIAHHKKAYPKAISFYQNSTHIADSLELRPPYFQAQQELAKTYAAMGDHEKAYSHHLEYAKVKDSVNDEERQERVAQLEERYKAEKRKREIKVLEKEKEKQKALAEARSQRDQAIIYTVSGGLLIVITLLVFLLTRFRIIRRQRDLIEQNRSELDQAYQKLEATHYHLQEKSKEVNDSIDYASFIQDAILPDEKERNAALGDHFAFLKPQGTVSGDLYWCHREAGMSFWAAVDCTGHGVPGAFMSMIAHSLLDETVIEKGIEDPGRILDELRAGLANKLGESDQKDGMDLVLCSLYTKDDGTPMLRTGGANNPLYLIRKGVTEDPPSFKMIRNGERIKSEEERIEHFRTSTDGISIKEDKRSVGFEERKAGNFTTVELPLQKGDLLYSFSDGFADQFGGDNSKKFRYRAFRELLLEVSSLPMEDQRKKLEERFEAWKGDHEQIDDVLVMGVKI